MHLLDGTLSIDSKVGRDTQDLQELAAQLPRDGIILDEQHPRWDGPSGDIRFSLDPQTGPANDPVGVAGGLRHASRHDLLFHLELAVELRGGRHDRGIDWGKVLDRTPALNAGHDVADGEDLQALMVEPFDVAVLLSRPIGCPGGMQGLGFGLGLGEGYGHEVFWTRRADYSLGTAPRRGSCYDRDAGIAVRGLAIVLELSSTLGHLRERLK